MVAAEDHPSRAARQAYEVMGQICAGHPDNWICIDAAAVGSPAHRVRVFGTNLAPPIEIQERYRRYSRDQANDRLEAQDVLDEGRVVQVSRTDDPRVEGLVQINRQGEPLRVFPTLVSTPASYAYRLLAEDVPDPGWFTMRTSSGGTNRMRESGNGSWGCSPSPQRRLGYPKWTAGVL